MVNAGHLLCQDRVRSRLQSEADTLYNRQLRLLWYAHAYLF